MALIITASGSDVNFSSNALGGILTSVRTNLIGEYLFGAALSTSEINYANNSNPLTVVGSGPAISSNYATFNANGFNTQLYADGELTVISIYKKGTADFGAALSNFNGSNANTSFGLFPNGLTNITYVQAPLGTSNSQATLVFQPPVSDWRMLAGRLGVGSNFAHYVDDFHNGVLTSNHSTNSGTRALNTTDPIRMGVNFSGTFNCAAALIYNRVLTDAELLTVYNEVRGLMASRSIPL